MMYWLEYDTQKKFRYAYKDLSFVGFKWSVCAQCSRRIGRPQYKAGVPCLLLEGGKTYPDFLQFCGAGGQLFLISEKTLSLFEKHGLIGYTGYQLVTANNVDRNDMLCPDYYLLNITGRIDLCTAAMHLKKKNNCPLCGQFEWNRMRLEPLILNQSTWDGSDLCLVDSIPGIRVCSEKAKEIIQSNKLTGFSFKNANIENNAQV